MKAEQCTPCWKFVISLDHWYKYNFLYWKTPQLANRQWNKVSKPCNIAFRSAINPEENLSVVNPVIYHCDRTFLAGLWHGYF